MFYPIFCISNFLRNHSAQKCCPAWQQSGAGSQFETHIHLYLDLYLHLYLYLYLLCLFYFWGITQIWVIPQKVQKCCSDWQQHWEPLWNCCFFYICICVCINVCICIPCIYICICVCILIGVLSSLAAERDRGEPVWNGCFYLPPAAQWLLPCLLACAALSPGEPVVVHHSVASPQPAAVEGCLLLKLSACDLASQKPTISFWARRLSRGGGWV